MARIKDVEIRDKSRMQAIINQEDGYINGTKPADQIGVSLHSFFNPDNIKESKGHIKVLTGNKEKYQGESPWDNVKERDVHPFLSLEMAAIKVRPKNIMNFLKK